MVEMSVDEVKLPAAAALPQFSPCGGTGILGIPAHRRHVGSLRKPPGAAVKQLQDIGTVEHRHPLARVLTVVTAYAEAFVFGAILQNECFLLGIGFLDAEHIGPLAAQHCGNGLAPLRPGVLAVLGPGIADVERHYLQPYGLQKHFFHHFIPGKVGMDGV